MDPLEDASLGNLDDGGSQGDPQGGANSHPKSDPVKGDDAGGKGDDANPKVERYKQLVEGSKKEALTQKQRADSVTEQAIGAYFNLAQQDAQHLLDLHEESPELAGEVAKRFGYASFEKAKAFIEEKRSGKSPSKKKDDKGLSEDEFNKKYDARRKQEVHEESLKEAEELIHSQTEDESDREAIKVQFDKITDGKTLTRAEAKEFAEMASYYVLKDKMKAKSSGKAKKQLSSTGLSGRRSQGQEENLSYEGINHVLDEHGNFVLDPKKKK